MASEERMAKTESVFREVNERIAESVQRFEADEGEFVCECHDPDCVHRVTATLEDYERVRSDGARFLVASGHEDEEVERVVRRRRGYRIVEKLDRLGTLVRRLDPRTKEA